MNLMMLSHEFCVAYVVNLKFGCVGTVLLRFLPNCIYDGFFCTEYAAIVQVWVLGAYIASKLCVYCWYNVFKLNCYELEV